MGFRSHGCAPGQTSGRFVDGRENAGVRAAAADVTLHGRQNLRIRRVPRGVQQGDCGHDHAGSAVGALHRAFFEKGLLDGMELLTLGQTFDGRDLLACGGPNGKHAGTPRLAVNQDGAGAALAFAATVLAPGQIEEFAEDGEEGSLFVRGKVVGAAVDLEGCFVHGARSRATRHFRMNWERKDISDREERRISAIRYQRSGNEEQDVREVTERPRRELRRRVAEGWQCVAFDRKSPPFIPKKHRDGAESQKTSKDGAPVSRLTFETEGEAGYNPQALA